MIEVWPNAFLPKERRGILLACVGTSLLGGAAIWLSLIVWSLPLAAVGFVLIFVPILTGIRPFIKPRARWFEFLLLCALCSNPVYQLAKSLLGPKEVPEAGLIGAGFFLACALMLGGTAYYLWRTGEKDEGVSSATQAGTGQE
jgi:hypothetical protein